MAIGFLSESSAGVNRHVRMASTTASVNGGVDRMTSAAVTRPDSDTAADTMTSAPAVMRTGTVGIEPPTNRAGSMSACASTEIVRAPTPSIAARGFM